MSKTQEVIDGVRAGTVDEAYAVPFLLDEIDRLRRKRVTFDDASKALNAVAGDMREADANRHAAARAYDVLHGRDRAMDLIARFLSDSAAANRPWEWAGREEWLREARKLTGIVA